MEIYKPTLPLPGFSFENCARNMALQKITDSKGANGQYPKIYSTGTTVVAVIFDNGVIMGADSRATCGNVISDRQCPKVYHITDSIYVCGAGTSADLQHVSKWLSANMQLLELNSARKASVVTALRRVKQHLFKHMGHVSVHYLIGGVDFTGPHLYSVDAVGTSMNRQYAADGSGSYAAKTVLEQGWKPKMTQEEAEQLITRSLEAGMFRDNASGNSFNLVTITKDNAEFKGPIVPKRLQTVQKMVPYEVKLGSTKILKHKVFKYDIMESMEVD